MSRLLVIVLLLQYATAKPISQHRSMVGGSLSSILPPGAHNIFPQIVKHDKRDLIWFVQAGDTGNAIAARFGIDFVQLASLNPTVQWTSLQIGQVLRIPCEDDSTPAKTVISQYTVAAGDTGNTIAAATGISFAHLDGANPGINWYNLQIGQVLTLPVSVTSVAMTGLGSSLPQSQGSSRPGLVTTTTMSKLSTTLSSDLSTGTSIMTLAEPSLSVTKSISSTESVKAPPESTSTSSNNSTPAGESAQPYPTEGPSTNPFLTPGGKRDLPLVKIRLVRNKQSRSTYTVKNGDTGLAIAAVYGISFDNLSIANPAVIWTNLQIGQNLIIPITQQAQVTNSTQVSSLMRIRKTGHDVYVMYSGPAVTPQYPAMDKWLAFETLWKSNLANIGTNCDFASGKVTANTQAETSVLKKAILAVSAETSVSASFILATILQESAGCVRAPTTKSWEGINNPGLMQSFKGRASCNTGSRIMQPCSDTMIKKMIIDGVKGNVNVGIMPALKTAASNFGVSWPMVRVSGQAQAQQGKPGPLVGVGITTKVDEALLYYQAARIYNSGSVPADGNLSGATGSTKCYVSDIVNRLTGWVNSKNKCSS